MSLTDLRKEALDLPENERALLAVALLQTLPPPEADISDEEVLQRDSDLAEGRVTEIPHEAFVRRVESGR